MREAWETFWEGAQIFLWAILIVGAGLSIVILGQLALMHFGLYALVPMIVVAAVYICWYLGYVIQGLTQ